MSFAVERGSPTKAQLYLDTVLDALVAETGREEDSYCIAKVIFKCLKDNPDDIRQIDGSTDKTYTNRQMLEASVRAALALQAAGLKPGDKIIIIGRNCLELSAMYYGSIFAGVILFPLHVGITVYELKHYIGLSDPRIVVTDTEHLITVEQALLETNSNSKIVLFAQKNTTGLETFNDFVAGFDDRVEDFNPLDTDRNSTVLLMSTSGTTGLPKAVIITNMGLVAQLPTLWFEMDHFPKPTRMYLCTGNAHWMTNTIAMITTPVYGVQLLTAAENITPELLRTLLKKYQFTWTMVSAVLAQSFIQLPGLQPEELSSLETLSMTGSAITDTLFNMIKKKVPPTTYIINVYGLTELHGGMVISRRGAMNNSLGTVMNTALFKVIDEYGNTLAPQRPGELCFKSPSCVFKGYINNQKAYRECFTEDGWFKSGDKVYMNEHEELFYIERIKFMIKYQSYHVSPSEIEGVICSVEGVQMAAVCDSEKGPAALVVVKSGFVVKAQTIHETVKGLLSDQKHLRGGIALVPSIPVSINGKIYRSKVKDIFQEIPKDKMFYDH